MKCLGDETELRFRAWIEQRRANVDKATGGKAGYIYVQSTGVDAQNELDAAVHGAVDARTASSSTSASTAAARFPIASSSC